MRIQFKITIATGLHFFPFTGQLPPPGTKVHLLDGEGLEVRAQLPPSRDRYSLALQRDSFGRQVEPELQIELDNVESVK